MSIKKKKITDLRNVTRIVRSFFEKSKILSSNEIESWLIMVSYTEMLLRKRSDKLNSLQLKTIESQLLEYWNDHMTHETEIFWKQIENLGITLKRKPTFERIINQKRFKSVEQAIAVYNDIYSKPIKNFESKELKTRLDKLYEVVKLDRDKRIKQFRKWIKNQSCLLYTSPSPRD